METMVEMVMTEMRVGGTSDGRNVGRFVRCGAPRFVSVVPTQTALAMDWRQIKNNTKKVIPSKNIGKNRVVSADVILECIRCIVR